MRTYPIAAIGLIAADTLVAYPARRFRGRKFTRREVSS